MNANSDASKLADIFCAEAAADYIGFWQLVRRVSSDLSCTSQVAIMEHTSELVRALLQRGLVAGELAVGGGFLRWENQSPEVVVDRIQVEWNKLEQPPDIGDVCWFDLPRINRGVGS